MRPGKPRGVRVRRSANTLRIAWRPAPGATRHLVRVRLADGRSKLFVLGRTARRHVFRGAGADRGTITVSGVSRLGREGPRAAEGVRAKKRKRTRRG